MKSITQREERVLQILWDIEEGFVKDVIARMDDPKPPYNTVSSIIRILETKGYVGHRAYGKTHQYFPIVSKEDFRKRSFDTLVRDYFSGSLEEVVSFMVDKEDLDAQEIRRIKALLDDLAQKQANDGN